MGVHALYELPAPAKINLFLHVIGRRADGYHLLQSVFALIDWCDTLHIEKRVDGQVRRHDLGLPLPEDDLCLRAARALQAASGCHLGADISIDKRLPSGAGLGGGSSDAATTLLALNRLWCLNWPLDRLLPLATGLGADVPFFVRGRNAWVEGIGERITPIALPASVWAVVKPSVDVPTAAIFGSADLARDTPAATLSDFFESPRSFGRNDLQACASAYSGKVSEALALLEDRFGASRMTGSGSAVFAELPESRASTGQAGASEERSGESIGAALGDAPSLRGASCGTAVIGALPPGWVGRICRSLSHHPLHGWAGAGEDGRR